MTDTAPQIGEVVTAAARLMAFILSERAAYPVGSPDWKYRTTAAWKLHQGQSGVATQDWTETPPDGWTGQ